MLQLISVNTLVWTHLGNIIIARKYDFWVQITFSIFWTGRAILVQQNCIASVDIQIFNHVTQTLLNAINQSILYAFYYIIENYFLINWILFVYYFLSYHFLNKFPIVITSRFANSTTMSAGQIWRCNEWPAYINIKFCIIVLHNVVAHRLYQRI